MTNNYRSIIKLEALFQRGKSITFNIFLTIVLANFVNKEGDGQIGKGRGGGKTRGKGNFELFSGDLIGICGAGTKLDREITGNNVKELINSFVGFREVAQEDLDKRKGDKDVAGVTFSIDIGDDSVGKGLLDSKKGGAERRRGDEEFDKREDGVSDSLESSLSLHVCEQ